MSRPLRQRSPLHLPSCWCCELTDLGADAFPRLRLPSPLPTLFICGRDDAATPEETTRYHRLVDGSQLVSLEQSSHSPFMEEREHFMQVVGDFLRQVEAGSQDRVSNQVD